MLKAESYLLLLLRLLLILPVGHVQVRGEVDPATDLGPLDFALSKEPPDDMGKHIDVLGPLQDPLVAPIDIRIFRC